MHCLFSHEFENSGYSPRERQKLGYPRACSAVLEVSAFHFHRKIFQRKYFQFPFVFFGCQLAYISSFATNGCKKSEFLQSYKKIWSLYKRYPVIWFQLSATGLFSVVAVYLSWLWADATMCCAQSSQQRIGYPLGSLGLCKRFFLGRQAGNRIFGALLE